MATVPELTHFGFGIFEHPNAHDYARRFRENREAMLSDEACAEFAAARDWLQGQGRAPHINRRSGSSYSLKHEAERCAGRYISNGMLIAAAVALGFRVARKRGGGPNVHLNVANHGH
jgi:hypothetical protein